MGGSLGRAGKGRNKGGLRQGEVEEGQALELPGLEGGRNGLGDLGWIQTPTPGQVSLTWGIQFCICDFAGTYWNSRIGVAAA